MEYKILIIKNRYKKKLNFKTGLDWFEKHTPIKMVVEEINTDDEIGFITVGNGTYGGVVPNHLPFKKYVPEGKYNAVVLVYGNEAPSVRVSICYNAPFYSGTDAISLAKVNDSGKTLNHELFHALFKNLSRKGIYLKDPMDTYLRDSVLELDNGITNRTMAMELLKPYWKKICEPVSILDKIKTVVTPAPKADVPNETKPIWKYFKPTEKTGSFGTIADLKFDLVTMLDQARDIAGVPFKITSGYRSPEHNKKVGGVKDSAHLTREAVDIACTSDANRWIIINSLISVGFNRIGVAKTFIHADIAKDKTQKVIWLY